MTQTTGVFVTQATDALFHFHFTKCWLNNLITVYNDIDSFKSSGHSHKLVCLQMPYPLTPEFETLVNDTKEHCDNMLILVSELHDRTLSFMMANDHKRISYFICGELNIQLHQSPIHKFYDWFTTTVHFYKFIRPELLNSRLDFYSPKPKAFDALLGRKKLHRDLVYKDIDKDKNKVTYLNSFSVENPNDFHDSQKWLWEHDGFKLIEPIQWTVDKVEYHGHKMSLSQIVPIEAYKETAYSIIAETNFNNHYSFYTEKTVKPILGHRLFIMVSGQYALQNLRKMGFKTFHNVMDESYDIENGLVERCKMIVEQTEYLASLPQEEILEKIRPICEYNYSHLMRTDWYGEYFMPAFVAYFLQT